MWSCSRSSGVSLLREWTVGCEGTSCRAAGLLWQTVALDIGGFPASAIVSRTPASFTRHTTARSAMYSYIARRLAFGALAVVGVSIVVFVVLRVLPGDPLVAIFGPEGFTKLSEAERARYMADLGLSDPLPVQYFHWVQDIIRGNLGHSFFRAES